MKNLFNIWTVIILALILRLININQSFWLDEAAQVIESSRPFWQQSDLAADFHPPLYHVLLHFWMYMGKSEIWVRLLSVVFSLASIYFIYQTAKLIVNKKTALISAAFLAISPYHIWYSHEARPYMAFLAFSLLSTFLLLKKKWIWYSVALVFSLYTHYFTLFLLVSHIIYVSFFEKKWAKNFFGSVITSLAVFLLWLPNLWKQLALGTGGIFSGWTEVVSVTPVKTSVLTFAKFIFGRGTIENNLLYSIVVLPVLSLFMLSIVKIWKEKYGKVLTVLFFIPLLTSESVSFFVSINAPQRLIFLLPVFYMILAFGICKLRYKLQIPAIFIVFLISLGGVYQYYTDPNVQREKWREAVVFTEQENSLQNAALFVFPEPFAPYIWYSRGRIDAWGIAPKFNITDNDLNLLKNRLENRNKIYLYQYLTGLTDPKGKTHEFLKSEGFKESDIKNFPGVGFIYIYDRE